MGFLLFDFGFIVCGFVLLLFFFSLFCLVEGEEEK